MVLLSLQFGRRLNDSYTKFDYNEGWLTFSLLLQLLEEKGKKGKKNRQRLLLSNFRIDGIVVFNCCVLSEGGHQRFYIKHVSN